MRRPTTGPSPICRGVGLQSGWGRVVSTIMLLQMTKIFIGLVFWNIVLFAVTAWTGYTHQPYQWRHFGMGLMTAIYTCLTHSIVMMHFMGSGRGIKEAIESLVLPAELRNGWLQQTRLFKARTSSLATLSCLLIMTAAILGAWTHTSPGTAVAAAWHRWIVWIAVLVNLYAFQVEYRVIADNAALIREIDRRMAGNTPPPSVPPAFP